MDRSVGISQRRRTWLVVAMLLVSAVWAIAVALSIPLAAAHSVDFNSYYAAAQAIRFDHGANIYSTPLLDQSAQAHGICAHVGHIIPDYLYPSFFAIVMAPLTLFPCGTVATAWLIGSALLWALSTALLADLLARRWPGQRLLATTIMVVMSLCCLPAFYGLFLGQVHILMLFGLTLAIWLVDREQYWLAGGVLAIITLIKLLPALVILYYLLRRRYRVVGGAAVVGLGGVALMLAYAGPATLLENVSALQVISAKSMAWATNESLRAVFPLVGYPVLALTSIITLGVLLRRRGSELLGVGWVLTLMLLVAPLVWGNYLIWLILAYCACFATLGPWNRANWRLWAALTALYLIMALPVTGPAHPLATLGLWGLAGALYWRSGAQPSAQVPAEPIAATVSA